MLKNFSSELMKDPRELICICMDVRRSEVEEAIRSGKLKSIEEIGEETDAGTNCGACHDDLEDILLERGQN